MMYKKPALSLLYDHSFKLSVDNENPQEYNAKIVDCLLAKNIQVKNEGTKVSPINMVFDYSLLSDSSYKSVVNLLPDISLAVGYDVKIFRRDDVGGVFSISVPKKHVQCVNLKDLLSSESYESSDSPLTLVAGIDERAQESCFDLAEAPHLLISGSTGSGKTVYLDDIILSILYKASPSQVNLVLVDPGADMMAYEGIPHLLYRPASTKPQVYEVVKFVRNRMNDRFDKLAKAGVRNIEAYNDKNASYMPRIVLIIDKYLEYTYEMPYDFEDCICEIARKGRAAGIHLIINAQSARSEVVSNDIKANIPYRIAFTVTDWHESKAIIDRTGAEKLLGNGDMMLYPGNDSARKRIQAPIVTLDEIKSVVSSIIAQNGKAEYISDFESVRKHIDNDTLYVIRILESIGQTNYLSIDSLQKKLDVDYAESIAIMDFLEKSKAVSSTVEKRGRTIDQSAVEKLLSNYRNKLKK